MNDNLALFAPKKASNRSEFIRKRKKNVYYFVFN